MNINEFTYFETFDGKDAEVTSNFSAEMKGWGIIKKGSMVLDPQYKGKGVEDVLTAANMNFQPLLVQTSFNSPITGIVHPSESYSVIRADNDKEVGRGFSKEYTPVGYLEQLDVIFGDLTKLGGIPTRVIGIGGGESCTIQFMLPDDYYVGGLNHRLFFNVLGSMDGSSGVGFNTSDICAICGNTYAMMTGSKNNRFSTKHTKRVGERLSEMANTVLAVKQMASAYYTLLDKAATVKLDDNALTAALFALVPDGTDKSGKVNSGPANRRAEIKEAVAVSIGERGDVQATALDLFSGALRYTSYRTQNRDDDSQYMYVTAGSGAKVNNQAYNWLVENVK